MKLQAFQANDEQAFQVNDEQAFQVNDVMQAVE